MVPVAPIITGVTFVYTFHMRCIPIVRSLYFRILESRLYYYYYYYYYCRYHNRNHHIRHYHHQSHHNHHHRHARFPISCSRRFATARSNVSDVLLAPGNAAAPVSIPARE
jgi:hypothetical protein